MLYKKIHFQVLFFLLLCVSHTVAQDFIWTAGNYSFFDNREYFNPYVDDQTITGSRIFGYAGFSLNENNRFAFGIDYLYEFGSKGELKEPDFIMFYKGNLKNVSLTIGAFPRYYELPIPYALFSDTIRYYRPNIEGISLEYHAKGFRHNVWIDWTSRQSYTKREIFMLGFSGYWSKGIFMYQHHFIMSHVAHSKNHDPDEHIRDNGGYTAMTGLNLSQKTRLDTLVLTSGLLGSYDRLRNVYDFSWPVGWITEAEICFNGFGVHGLYYTGDEQVIVSGDGFYQAGSYGRTDIYYQRKTRQINGRLQFSLHFIPGIIDHSFSLVIRAQLDGNVPLNIERNR